MTLLISLRPTQIPRSKTFHLETITFMFVLFRSGNTKLYLSETLLELYDRHSYNFDEIVLLFYFPVFRFVEVKQLWFVNGSKLVSFIGNFLRNIFTAS